MLPLVHNTIHQHRSRSQTMSGPHSSRSSSTTNVANSSTNQYSVEQLTKDSSDCKKLKSGKVCATANRPFLKKRSLTFSSLFSPKSSRSASTNSLQSSLVDQTIASVLQPINFSEFLNESNKTASESNLNSQVSARRFFSGRNSSRLCKANSTTSTLTDENAHLDNLASSFGSDLDINSNSQSTNELNRHSDEPNSQQATPNFPPPSYTPLDPSKRIRRPPLLLRSQSAPQPFYFHRSASAGAGELFSNTQILENIQEISDQHSLLPEVVEEDEDQVSMASRRSSYLNHQFSCRLAHEKETLPIPRFNTVKELYERISLTFNIDVDQILFCTLNTNKTDMDNLFDRQINLKDTIYVHVKGQAKEIEIEKTDPLLGLTICDNQNGLCLIKKIKEGSVIDKIKFINVGDVIERINSTNLLGYRHIDVANMLKSIPVGELFVIRLIEPCRDSDESSSHPLSKQLKNKIKKGHETLRIRRNRPAIFEEEEEDEINDDAVKKIDSIIEDFVGISDSELVQQILDIGKERVNPHDFLMAINESDLKAFNFSEEIIFDIWAAIRDSAKSPSA